MKKSVKILIVVLCLIIVGLVAFIVVDKIISNNKENIADKNDTNIVAENENNSSNNDFENSVNEIEKSDNSYENEIWNATNNNSENNSIQNVSYNNANQAIKNALMDETWLKEEGLDIDLDIELQDGNTVWRTSMYIIKINDIENMPAYLIRSHVVESSYTKLVTYKDDKVYVSKTSAGWDYCDEFVDIENNIVKSVSGSTGITTIYRIKNYEFEILDEYDMEEESFEKYKEGSFKGILVEMTTENINKIVK